MPWWWLLRYHDVINNPSSTFPTNLTLLEKVALLDKSEQILIAEIDELKKRIDELEKKAGS